MNWCVLAFLLFLPLKVLGEGEHSVEKIVDVIHCRPSPSRYGQQTSAVLSIDLKDLKKFTLCFAFMVEVFPDVEENVDEATLQAVLNRL